MTDQIIDRYLRELSFDLARMVMDGELDLAKSYAPQVSALYILSENPDPETFARMSALLDKTPSARRWHFERLRCRILGPYCLYGGPGRWEEIRGTHRKTCFLLGLHMARLERDGRMPRECGPMNVDQADGAEDGNPSGLTDDEYHFLEACEDAGKKWRKARAA